MHTFSFVERLSCQRPNHTMSSHAHSWMMALRKPHPLLDLFCRMGKASELEKLTEYSFECGELLKLKDEGVRQ